MRMEWLLALNQSLDYLEEHLEEKIDLARAAQIAGCSVYHYQRIFPTWQGCRCPNTCGGAG